MKKLRTTGLVLFMALASAVFLTWSCGGGSSGGGGEPPAPQPLSPASMDQTTAETVMAMGMTVGDISDISDSFLDRINGDARAAGADPQGAPSLAAWVLKNLQEGFLAGKVINVQDVSRAGSVDESDSCDESGSLRISGTWSGPDEPTDVCDVSNATVTLGFSNCQEYGDTVNGTVTISINGDLCAPTGISLRFRGFSLTDSYNSLEVEADSFDMAMTQLQYSGGEMTHSYATLNGDIALNSLDMKFSQFSEELTIGESTQTVSVNGSVSGACFDGWVTFTTLSPVQSDEYSECPLSGSVKISGDTDMVVSFYSDGSMTIGDQTYASCSDLPDVCR